eukprot:TRINITY_DN1916_c0_g1_i1.p1 TRINITY_DN1916_c0_g1~~TRINITY_DN1916_c0_g1_i1.p1  ORF type:complete len:246 (+),score=67.11 TRINITY_DN1916_c0_g1_i1:99-740(+)
MPSTFHPAARRRRSTNPDRLFLADLEVPKPVSTATCVRDAAGQKHGDVRRKARHRPANNTYGASPAPVAPAVHLQWAPVPTPLQVQMQYQMQQLAIQQLQQIQLVPQCPWNLPEPRLPPSADLDADEPPALMPTPAMTPCIGGMLVQAPETEELSEMGEADDRASEPPDFADDDGEDCSTSTPTSVGHSNHRRSSNNSSLCEDWNRTADEGDL